MLLPISRPPASRRAVIETFEPRRLLSGSGTSQPDQVLTATSEAELVVDEGRIQVQRAGTNTFDEVEAGSFISVNSGDTIFLSDGDVVAASNTNEMYVRSTSYVIVPHSSALRAVDGAIQVEDPAPPADNADDNDDGPTWVPPGPDDGVPTLHENLPRNGDGHVLVPVLPPEDADGLPDLPPGGQPVLGKTTEEIVIRTTVVPDPDGAGPQTGTDVVITIPRGSVVIIQPDAQGRLRIGGIRTPQGEFVEIDVDDVQSI